MGKYITSISAVFFLTTSLIAQDATEIIRKADEKTRGKITAYSEFTISIVRPKWTREMSLKSWSKGEDYSLILLTAPAKEKGAAFLQRKKEVWNWIPSIERTIKLPPSMMSQSWMGTDFTNDDLVKESSQVYDYVHTIKGDTILEGRNCYKILLTPKPDAAVVWGKIITYIDSVDYIQLRAEMYDEDDFLVNIINSSEIKEMGVQLLATQMEMIPVEKDGHKTILTMKEMVFDKPIADNFFTTRNMKKVK